MNESSSKDVLEGVRSSRVFSNLIDLFQLDTRKVLDVGCSEGHHLQCFGSESVGVTIIEEHVQKAEEKGLRVIQKNVEDPHFDVGEHFDVVWANNLFEHLHSPHLFLVKMRDVINSNGTLILGVPVIPHLSFLTRFKKFRGAYAVSHINFFNRRTLIETVRAGGWIVHEARLFYMKSSLLDWLFNLIAPHIYIIASPDPNFSYPEKRLRSLKGYT